METKHTPGPWDVDECRYGFAVYARKSGDAVVKTEDVEGRYGAIDNEADARLIAAAPELLEALVALFNDYKRLADSGDAGFWRLEDLPEGKQALAAIAKATGEQP